MAAVRFGVFLSPSRDNSLVVPNAQAAAASGFDFISIQDHPYQPDVLDPFVLMALIAGVTSRPGLITAAVAALISPISGHSAERETAGQAPRAYAHRWCRSAERACASAGQRRTHYRR